jgi:CBS domain-containing protein
MLDHRVGGLPVVEAGQLVGIVTSDDLLRALLVVVETAALERISVELTGPRDA